MRPKTLNEKILRKMLFDRNPRLTLFADKFLVRNYVRSKLGDSRYLTKLYGVVSTAEEISQLNLPNKFVMKPNHVSAMIRFVRDLSDSSLGELQRVARRWLKVNFFDKSPEWAYKNIKPRVIFEEFLEVSGKIPYDYKFYCFNGQPRFLMVSKDRFGVQKRNYYDTNLSLLPVRYKGYENFEDGIKPLPNFETMMQVARKLSAGVDFVRVDLYNINGRIVFGELTNYPMGGRLEYEPPERDLEFGKFWK